MKSDLGLNDAQMGYVFSAFTFAYALMEIPSGWLADRFGIGKLGHIVIDHHCLSLPWPVTSCLLNNIPALNL